MKTLQTAINFNKQRSFKTTKIILFNYSKCFYIRRVAFTDYNFRPPPPLNLSTKHDQFDQKSLAMPYFNYLFYKKNKRSIVIEWVCEWHLPNYREAELLKIYVFKSNNDRSPHLQNVTKSNSQVKFSWG